MLNKIIFILLFLVTIFSYIYSYEEVTLGIIGVYHLISACLMFWAMYAGAFSKCMPYKLIKFIFINTLVTGTVGIYQELNANFDLMTNLELLSYATFIIIYYGLSLRLIRLVQNNH